MSHVPVAGMACDDGNACSVDDVCDAAGSCQAGTLLPLDDGDPCTADVCDPVLGVSHPVTVGAACDDGNACSQTDVCAADGTCLGSPLPGLDDANPCTTDTCDPVTGSIAHEALPDGTSCSDGNACNGLEVCQGMSEVTLPVTAMQTFLHVSHLDSYYQPPTIVRLSEHGFGPGRRVRISTIGRFTAPNVADAFAVFSSDTRFLDRAAQHRVPGAIQSEAPAVVTGETPFDGVKSDIPQDFIANDAGIELTIPEGARYLFLGCGDSWFADNSGALQVVMRAVEPACVQAEPAPVRLSCTLADGSAGVCDGTRDCVACTAQPALCE